MIGASRFSSFILADAVLQVNETIAIPEDEFAWSFARSGGPGGQNVNKVASKAVLRWDVAHSPSLPAHVKHRLRALQRKRFTTDGELILSSQRTRDQSRQGNEGAGGNCHRALSGGVLTTANCG